MLGKVRLNLDMSQQVSDRINMLCVRTDQNKSQVLRKALAIYELLLVETNSGEKIIRRKSDGSEVEILIV